MCGHGNGGGSSGGFQNGVPWGAIRLVSDDADEMFDADEVIEYSRETASHVIAAILLETSARL